MQLFRNLTFLSLALTSLGCSLYLGLLEPAAQANRLAGLEFTVQPRSQSLGVDMPTLQVQGYDELGHRLPLPGGEVELSLADNSARAHLLENGQPTVAVFAPAEGSAQFSHLRVDNLGSNFTLLARYQVPASGRIFTVTSDAFGVAAARDLVALHH